MKNYKTKLEEQLKEIDSLITKTAHSLSISKSLPNQRVTSSRSNGCDQFVWVDRTTKARRYVKASEAGILRKIVQRDYEAKVNKKLRQMKGHLENLVNNYDISGIEEIYEKMSEPRKKLVIPVIEPENEFLKKWTGVSYDPMPVDNDTAFYSGCGVRVRSKSELLIANMLEQKGIPYRYEYPLFLKSGGNVRPDFLCLNVRKRAEFIWEHFGMMDNIAYANKNIEKIQNYGQNGYIAGKNMIMTFETSQNPVNSIMIRKMIEAYLI